MLNRLTLTCLTALMTLPAFAGWRELPAISQLVGDDQPLMSGIRLQLPVFVEDGAAVPVSIDVESPMLAEQFIESLYLFASANPNPEVIEWHFTPEVGQAKVGSRIRINETQTLWALAKDNHGQWRLTSADIEVLTSGCLVSAPDQASVHLSNPRVAVRGELTADQATDVRTLVTHPMESGLRQGPDGATLSKRIVDELRVELNERTLLRVRMHGAVSANPYVQFWLQPQEQGTLTFTWREDQGNELVHSLSF